MLGRAFAVRQLAGRSLSAPLMVHRPPPRWGSPVSVFAQRAYASSRGGPTSVASAGADPVPNSTDITPENARLAFQAELSALATHSTLLNQTSPAQLLNLADVVPMMQIYATLVEHNAGFLALRKVTQALRQTAKDATLALRTLTQSQRAHRQSVLFNELRDALDVVASSIIENGAGAGAGAKAPLDVIAISNVFTAYEIVDPFAGVRFFHSMPRAMQSLCGSAVIPCMVKARCPFSEIRAAFETERDPTPRGAANMAWACLRYGELDAARALFDEIVGSRESGAAAAGSEPSEHHHQQQDEHDDHAVVEGAGSPAVRAFLIDVFVGDAPADLALRVFREHSAHAPHHASMTRMLTRLWDREHSIPLQISVFREYLERLAERAQAQSISELSIKTVSTALVSQVVAGSATPDEALPHIIQVSRIYDSYMPRHTILLNVILTEISNKWSAVRDEARELILAILENYGPADDDSVVAFRVRLNALESLSDTDELARELWTARQSQPRLPPLQMWDWFALARATNASSWFKSEWEGAGSPFNQNVRRFCKSRGYPLS